MLRDWEFWFQLSDGDKDLFRECMSAAVALLSSPPPTASSLRFSPAPLSTRLTASCKHAPDPPAGYAFLALRKRWAVPARHLSTASWLDKNALGGDKSDRFAGHTMLQYGLASEVGGNKPRPLFVHANLLKRITA